MNLKQPYPLTAAIGLALATSVLGGCVSDPERRLTPEVNLPDRFQKTPDEPLQRPASPALQISRTLSSWPAGPLEQSPITLPGQPTIANAVTTTLPKPAADMPMDVMSLNETLPQWWRLLGNSELNRLIDRALANNQDIRIANARIAQAKARADQADADRYPTITAPIKATIEAPPFGVGTVARGQSVTSRKVFEASLRGDWRPDLWGEKSGLLESTDLQVWRMHFQRDDVQRKLISEITGKYVEYLSLGDRLAVARETETVLSGMLASVEERMKKGDATVIDMQQQRSAVYAVRATIPALQQQREAALNALAQLAGTVPGQLQLKDDAGLDSLSYPTITPGTPSSLLLRRPDIRAVEARMLSAGADIKVARARILPPLDLSAQVGYGSLHLAQLLQPQSLMWNVVAGLVGTIFDHGKRDKEVAYNKAVHEEMVETYIRTIYLAMREVEDALNAGQMTEQRAAMQLEATGSARQAYINSNEAYSAGAIDYLTLLDTERTYHRNLDELHQLRMAHYKAMVELFAALGGGVETPPQENDTGTVVATPATIPDKNEGLNVEVSNLAKDKVWMVELAGMHDRERVAPLWRDLRERFPEWMKQRFIVPRLVSNAPLGEPAQGKASLYRLFVARFDLEEDAKEFCAELQAGQMRCQAVQGLPR